MPADPRFDDTRAYLETVAAQLSALTGFSTFAPMQVVPTPSRRRGPVAAGAVYVVHADPPFEAAPVTATEHSAAGTAGADVIEIQPVVPLEAKTRYVYVVTNAARDAGGHPLRRDPDLTRALRGDAAAAGRLARQLSCPPSSTCATISASIRNRSSRSTASRRSPPPTTWRPSPGCSARMR